jgi:hypothetical protein
MISRFAASESAINLNFVYKVVIGLGLLAVPIDCTDMATDFYRKNK